MTETSNYELLAEKMEKYRKQTQQASLKYYKKKYAITDDMTEEEKEMKRKNIELRKEQHRKRYEANKEYHREKSKAYRERVKAQRLQQMTASG